MSVKAILQLVKRKLRTCWLRPYPFGLVSIAFLNPFAAPLIQKHRQFFCRGPTGTALSAIVLCNLVLWLRWVFFRAWRQSYHCVKVYGADVETAHGITRLQQFNSCIGLAIAHSIPPASYYKHKFYLAPSAKQHWSYVYHNELPAYHLRQDREGSESQRKLLGDKQEFAQRMQSHGIPVASGVVLPAGTRYSDLSLEADCSYFLKPVRGSAAYGVFQLDIDSNNSPRTLSLWGKPLKAQKAIDDMESLFAEQRYLLQPCYKNHPQLDALLDEGDEVITLRIISWRTDDDIFPYCAYLEIPYLNENKNKGYLTVQINTDTGKANAQSLDHFSFYKQDVISRYKAKLTNFAIPLWQECLACNVDAHRQFPDVYAIAWDNVITADGVVVLEGNSNWNIELPQVFCGGILDNPLLTKRRICWIR